MLCEYEDQCDIIGLQEMRRSGQSVFIEAGYIAYCSCECGGDGGGRKGQRGVEVVVKKAILARTTVRPPEFISDRLLKVILELRGRARAVTFVVAYAPIDIHYTRKSMLSGRPWTVL